MIYNLSTLGKLIFNKFFAQVGTWPRATLFIL